MTVLSQRRANKLLLSGLLFFAGVTVMEAPATAALQLHCEFDASGQRQSAEFAPERDPYGIEAIAINDHFRFKAVVIGSAGQIDYIKLYSYYVTRRKPVLLLEAKYLHPMLSSGEASHSLTGVNTVYSPILERQFEYECALREGGA